MKIKSETDFRMEKAITLCRCSCEAERKAFAEQTYEAIEELFQLTLFDDGVSTGGRAIAVKAACDGVLEGYFHGMDIYISSAENLSISLREGKLCIERRVSTHQTVDSEDMKEES